MIYWLRLVKVNWYSKVFSRNQSQNHNNEGIDYTNEEKYHWAIKIGWWALKMAKVAKTAHVPIREVLPDIVLCF